MNVNKIKEKLAELNKGNSSEDKVDFSKVMWKPEMGKSNIRIVPSFFNPEYPFKEIKFHYKIGKYPIPSLSNFGKQDPVEELVAQLKTTSERENWVLAGTITPRARIFAPVIVRGEEEMGVRLWGFGVTIYKALLALAEDEDIGDFTDVNSGYDMVVEKSPGSPYPETTVRIKPKEKPLAEDSTTVETWLSTQPDPLGVFTQYDYEFIKKQLGEFLGELEQPAENTETSVESTKTETTAIPEVAIIKEQTKGTSKFDTLFGTK
jgi:hypothetical protein